MHIAQLAPTGTPISASQNKAIYSHIGQLVDECSARGHQVTSFAHGHSRVSGELISPTISSDESSITIDRYKQWESLSDCYFAARNGMFDVIHSHLSIMTGFFSRLELKTPTLISIHSPIEDWMKPIFLKYRDEKYISFSLAQRAQLPGINWYANIYHGVDTNLFAFNDTPEDYVLFLGRITHDKGAHIAIAAAQAANIPLRVAGRSYSSESYWHDSIEPFINGSSVRYFGEVSLDDKIPLIQNAKALIFPTLYQEVFGYVLIEAMSCGTPVIAFPNGSVPEIVKDGVTGFLVNNETEMIDAIKKIDTIDRKQVRRRAEQFFSLKQMITHYEHVYSRVIEEAKIKNSRKQKLASASKKTKKTDVK